MSFCSISQKIVADLEQVSFFSIAADKSLYMPTHLDRMPDSFLKNIDTFSFHEMATQVAHHFLKEEIEKKELENIVKQTFDFPIHLHWLRENMAVLELFHGPTFAFKDFGARFLSKTLSHLLEKREEKITILVATSGDTGSAVANSFFNLKNIRVVLLYPKNMISAIQEKQLTTYGGNITAVEVAGTFDDCQSLVKKAFEDTEIRATTKLVSANSINIIRLLPQSFYYFYAYGEIVKKRNNYTPLVVSVPSGNLGNLTAGVIAKKIGLPIDYFISCSNANDIFPQYLQTRKFLPRKSIPTISNAMDVGNPNNFSRIEALYEKDYHKICRDIRGFSLDDEHTKKAMRGCFEKYNYVCDPHTAIAFASMEDELKEDTQGTGFFLATAHPAKFQHIVEQELNIEIPLPSTLEKTLQKNKKALPIQVDYEVFKKIITS